MAVFGVLVALPVIALDGFNESGEAVLGLFIIFAVMGNIIGTILGAVALNQTQYKKLYGILGVSINGFVLIALFLTFLSVSAVTF